MADANYHRAGAEKIKADRARIDEIARTLETNFDRWAELEEKARAAEG
jgi:hypothetical protein